ncbi:major facilitator superfamily domain-containing protein, partial [Syncephalis pseudoplumigaleata]
LAVVPWGSLSDRLGRRPLLIMGMLSATVSALFLALSRSYEWLFVFVVAKGLCSPSLAAVRSALGDITDSETQGKAFRLLFAMFVAGSTVGPVVAGQLADMRRHMPAGMEQSAWLRDHPYFLPFMFSAAMSFTGFLAVVFCFRETMAPESRPGQHSLTASTKQQSQSGRMQLRDLFRGHTIALASMCAFELVDGMLESLFGLWISTPTNIGGLSMQAGDSGIIAGVAGVAVFITHMTLYPRLERAYGSRRLYSLVLLLLLPLSVLTPRLNALARSGSDGAIAWLWVCLLSSTCCRGVIEITALTSLQLIVSDARLLIRAC